MNSTSEQKHTLCRLCSACCPVTVTVERGKLISARLKTEFVEPGYTCPKLQHAADIVYSDQRLASPLLRSGRGQPWQRISWDQAYTQMADTLTGIKERFGAQSLCWLRGQAADWGAPWHYAMRFMHAFGSPNAIGNGSVCHAAREMLHVYTYGAMTSADYKNAGCIIIWGMNERNSKPSRYNSILKAKERGAGLVVIDPIQTKLARLADIWLPVTPGGDGLLAMAMMHTIISEDLYDHAFVRDWTVGFEELKKAIQKYSPERIAGIIGLQADRIVQVARLYAGAPAACIAEGNGIDMSPDTSQNTRAICILRALTGNLDKKGGDILSTGVSFKDITLKDRLDPGIPSLACDYPLFNSYHRDRGIQTLGPLLDAILEEKPYPIKAMIIQASNPAVTAINTHKFAEAMKRLEFVVVIDFFETKTTAMADMILPTTTGFEKTQLNLSALSSPRVNLQNQIIDCFGESRPDWQIVFELARSLGFEQEFPWRTVEEAIDDQLQPSGITVAELRQNPGGIIASEKIYQAYREKGFATLSGKVEIYSQAFTDHGYPSLPDFDIAADRPISYSSLKETYPYTAVSGERSRFFVHSQFRQIKPLRQEEPEPYVDINREDARSEGINDGDTIRIETPNGVIEMPARVGDLVQPGFVRIAWGWGELSDFFSINALTDDTDRDPITSTTSNRTFRCRINKVTH